MTRSSILRLHLSPSRKNQLLNALMGWCYWHKGRKPMKNKLYCAECATWMKIKRPGSGKPSRARKWFPV